MSEQLWSETQRMNTCEISMNTTRTDANKLVCNRFGCSQAQTTFIKTEERWKLPLALMLLLFDVVRLDFQSARRVEWVERLVWKPEGQGSTPGPG